jgi:O-antigen/teichoic acid export membrane protein
MWCFVLSAIIDSMYPSIMEAHKADAQLFEKRNRQLYAAVFYISVTVSLGICLLAKPIVLILFGRNYMPAVAPLRVITWYTAFSYLGVARNAWIVSENKGKYLKYIYVSAAVCNVALNLVFIPLWGATGAAVASLITQILTVVVIPFLIKPLKQNSLLMVDAILLRNVK